MLMTMLKTMLLLMMMMNPMEFAEECVTVATSMVSIFIKQSHMINLERVM